MSQEWRGESTLVTVYCGPERTDETSRLMYRIWSDENHQYVNLDSRQAKELVILLQAALIGYRGEL